MIKKNLKILIITSVIILLPIVAGLILWNKFPDEIPIHFNAHGVADGWSGKGTAVFANFLAGLLIFYLMFFSAHFAVFHIANIRRIARHGKLAVKHLAKLYRLAVWRKQTEVVSTVFGINRHSFTSKHNTLFLDALLMRFIVVLVPRFPIVTVRGVTRDIVHTPVDLAGKVARNIVVDDFWGVGGKSDGQDVGKPIAASLRKRFDHLFSVVGTVGREPTDENENVTV